MRPATTRLGAMILTIGLAVPALANEGTMANSVLAQGNRASSPTPEMSPGAGGERDRESRAPEVGIGRSTGAVKSSGDEGGTAAGMPGKAPGSPAE